MAMDFFENQEVAQRRSKRLIILFVLAVVSMTLMIYGTVVAIVYISGVESEFFRTTRPGPGSAEGKSPPKKMLPEKRPYKPQVPGFNPYKPQLPRPDPYFRKKYGVFWVNPPPGKVEAIEQLGRQRGVFGKNPPRTSLQDLPLTYDHGFAPWFNLPLLGIVTFSTGLVIGVGSLFKIAQLQEGGRVIAEELGGRLIDGSSRNALDKKVTNVVEEMAIASGTPTPPVYLMDKEEGINAFAAGYSPDDAVIGITRGAAERLTRAELQGVVAHEFSHILNGDMRINIRLIGMIHGILIIGIIGYYIMRSALFSGHSRRSSDRDGDSNPLPMIALGLALIVIGFLGTFFGNMIKASVSRQREFLADAAAVQFTRDPGGISGALKRIGGFSHGSTIASPNAPEASHMFFGSGLQGLFATHPPLKERIGRILPGWDGALPDTDASTFGDGDEALSPGAAGFAGSVASVDVATDVSGPAMATSALEQIGQPSEAHVQYAASLRQQIPETLLEAAHEPYAARTVIYALLADPGTEAREIQFVVLRRSADNGEFESMMQLLPMTDTLPPEHRLPLVEIAIPALRRLSGEQYTAFKENVGRMVRADQTIDLLEWILQRLVFHHLEPHFNPGRRADKTALGPAPFRDHSEMLLSCLAHIGHTDQSEATHAFDAGAAVMVESPSTKLAMAIRGRERCTLQTLDEALEALRGTRPKQKRLLLRACADCVTADQKTTAHELEVLRVISDSLDAPMPPILPPELLA